MQTTKLLLASGSPPMPYCVDRGRRPAAVVQWTNALMGLSSPAASGQEPPSEDHGSRIPANPALVDLMAAETHEDIHLSSP